MDLSSPVRWRLSFGFVCAQIAICMGIMLFGCIWSSAFDSYGALILNAFALEFAILLVDCAQIANCLGLLLFGTLWLSAFDSFGVLI